MHGSDRVKENGFKFSLLSVIYMRQLLSRERGLHDLVVRTAWSVSVCIFISVRINVCIGRCSLHAGPLKPWLKRILQVAQWSHCPLQTQAPWRATLPTLPVALAGIQYRQSPGWEEVSRALSPLVSPHVFCVFLFGCERFPARRRRSLEMLMRCCVSECLRIKGMLKLMRCRVQADEIVVCLNIWR